MKSVKISTSQYQGEVRTLSEGENFPPINWRGEISFSSAGRVLPRFCGQKRERKKYYLFLYASLVAKTPKATLTGSKQSLPFAFAKGVR
jgi:hypothetical protein